MEASIYIFIYLTYCWLNQHLHHCAVFLQFPLFPSCDSKSVVSQTPDHLVDPPVASDRQAKSTRMATQLLLVLLLLLVLDNYTTRLFYTQTTNTFINLSLYLQTYSLKQVQDLYRAGPRDIFSLFLRLVLQNC